MQKASEAEKRAYLQKMTEESRALQRKVGQQRFDARMEYKKTVVQFANNVADEMRNEIIDQTSGGNLEATDASGQGGGGYTNKWLLGLTFLAIGLGVFYRLVRSEEERS